METYIGLILSVLLNIISLVLIGRYRVQENEKDVTEEEIRQMVDAGGDIDEDGTDSKISCTELRILKQLNRKEFFLHALAYMVDHPHREWSSHVKADRAAAHNGFTVVRGPDPLACGKQGDYLALAKENPVNGKIEQIALAQVDGETILPDVWYDVNFEKRTGGLF